MKHVGISRWSALVALLVLALCTSTQGQTNLSESDAERLRRLAEGPFRYILLHKDSKPKAPAAAAAGAPKAVAAPAPRPGVAGRALEDSVQGSPAKKAESDTARSISETQATTAPAAGRVQAPSAEAPARANGVNTEPVQAVIDMDKAVVSPQGLISDPQGGGYVTPLMSRFSERIPNPVQASMALDTQAGLLRVDYKVPASVGTHGGAEVHLQLPGDGADLSALLPPAGEDALPFDLPPPGSGLLEIELDTAVPTRLKIALVGPQERPDGAYPYFILPVQPGRRTYGLWLADFHQAKWAKGAPDLATALRRVLSVSVGYSRGDAHGLGDEGRFSIGQVAFLRRAP